MSVQPQAGKGGDVPAFPMVWWDRDSSGETVARECYPGMSFRAWAATKMLQGILAGSPERIVGQAENLSTIAVNYADALVEALKESPASPKAG
jgi:hypothetical protein